MAHVESGQDRSVSRGTDADTLFKPDRPRDIDRYIDYFEGRPGTDSSTSDDACGEGLLDALVDRDAESGAA